MNNNKNLVNRILNIVALGMGAAVIVLSILGAANAETGMVMLSMGVFALGLKGLSTDNQENDQ